MRTVVCDIEANGLIPTKIWCIVAKDIKTGEVYEFTGEEMGSSFRAFSNSVSTWIGHNFLSYDRKWLNKLLGTDIKVNQVVDTFILSMLFNINRERPYGIKGQHSLESWGARFKLNKPHHEDWSCYSDAMLDRCRTDVEINHKTYNYLMIEGKEWSEESIKLEHQIQYLLDVQKDYGVYFDQMKAHKLLAETGQRVARLREEIQEAFGRKAHYLRQVVPKYKKDGKLSMVGVKGLSVEDPSSMVVGTFSLIEWREFNIDSPKQIVERLDEAGWIPIVFNKPTSLMKKKGLKYGSPKVCEENLETLPPSAPQSALKLKEYAIINSRVRNIKTWFEALGEDGRIHGTIIGCGANTHRAAHREPNTANIPAIETKEGKPALYGKECRECWGVHDRVNRRFVGVDAAGIQLRVLAHYMGDASYTEAIVNGKKEDGTDVHSINLKAGGLGTRNQAKTFIYALLLGAGDAKLGTILGSDSEGGRIARDKLVTNIPALGKVVDMCTNAFKRGYINRIDGGRLTPTSLHKTLACYLQAGEAVIMKKAYVLATARLKQKKLDAHIVLWVHDEFQLDCHKEHAEEAGQIVAESIKKAGEFYKLRCPMQGEVRIGTNWAETH